jgi:hypothetical protein
MPINRHKKGKTGELEFSLALQALLGLRLDRRLCQTREGGLDFVQAGFPFCVEVRRREKLQVDKWWDETIEKAQEATKNAATGAPGNTPTPYPALAFRINRKPWTVRIPIASLAEAYEGQSLWMAIDTTIEVFAMVCRELLARQYLSEKL